MFEIHWATFGAIAFLNFFVGGLLGSYFGAYWGIDTTARAVRKAVRDGRLSKPAKESHCD